MNERTKCYYCGCRTYKGNLVCPGCAEKLKLVRRLIAIGVEIRLRAAKERSTGNDV